MQEYANWACFCQICGPLLSRVSDEASICSPLEVTIGFVLRFKQVYTSVFLMQCRYVKKIASEPSQSKYVDPDVPRGFSVFNPSNRSGTRIAASLQTADAQPVSFCPTGYYRCAMYSSCIQTPKLK